MQYRSDKYGNKISVLGYGCMRFTQKGGKIDLVKTEQEIMAAYEQGVNYYDTAYIYLGSEAVLGSILEKHGIRKNVYIATKLPHYIIKTKEDAEKYFQEELKRLQTDYIDYYLMHMTGISVKFSIIIWMNIHRQEGQDFYMQRQKAFRL